MLLLASFVVPAYETVFESRLEIPASQQVYDDDDVVVGDKTCASWRASGQTVPSGCQPGEPPDRAIFTPTFEVTRDKKSLSIDLVAPTLFNSWVGADVALIDDERGYVYEGVIDIEYYAHEGSREGRIRFGRIPKGRYLVRIDPAWEQGQPEPELRLVVRSDTAEPGVFLESLFVFIWIFLIGVFLAAVFLISETIQRVIYWLMCIAFYCVIALLGAHVFGFDWSSAPVNQVPESVRRSPGGYRSWAFWHAGSHGGK